MKALSRLAATLFSLCAGGTLVLFLITSPLSGHRAEAGASTASGSAADAPGGVLEQTEWLVLAGLSGFFGLAWLLSVLRRPPAGHPPGTRPPSHESVLPKGLANEEVLEQFESNWKTFAAYTQDLLDHKLKELEEVPRQSIREIREHLGGVSDALADVRTRLEAVGEGTRSSTGDVARQVVQLLREEEKERSRERQPTRHDRDILARIEKDFDRVKDGIVQLQGFLKESGQDPAPTETASVELRVADALEDFKAQWQEQVHSFNDAMEHAWSRNEALLEELTRLRGVEEALRLDLAEAAVREKALGRDVEAEKKHAENAAREREGARRREDALGELLRDAQEREREALNRIEALEETLARGTTTPDAEDQETVATEILRRELSSLRATFESIRVEKERLDPEAPPAEETGPPGEARDLPPMDYGRPGAEITAGRLEEVTSENRRLLEELEEERDSLLEKMESLRRDMDLERREAENVRRVQEVLVDGGLPCAVVTANADLEIFTWNPAAEELWGKKAEVMLGQELSAAALPTLDVSVVESAREALRKSGRVELPRTSFRDGRGRRRHVQGRCDAIPGPDGQAIGVVLCLEDVTDETEDEIDARCQALFTQGLADSLPVGLVVLDARTRVVSWNSVAETILGVPEESALGQELFSLDTPFAKPAFRKYFERTSPSRESHRTRLRMAVKGVPAHYVLTISPFVGSDDTIRGTVLLMQPAVEMSPSAR